MSVELLLLFSEFGSMNFFSGFRFKKPPFEALIFKSRRTNFDEERRRGEADEANCADV
jgi:hypothetical protein